MAKQKNAEAPLPSGLKELATTEPSPASPSVQAVEPVAELSKDLAKVAEELDPKQVDATARMLFVGMVNSHQSVQKDVEHLAKTAYQWAEIFHRVAQARK